MHRFWQVVLSGGGHLEQQIDHCHLGAVPGVCQRHPARPTAAACVHAIMSEAGRTKVTSTPSALAAGPGAEREPEGCITALALTALSVSVSMLTPPWRRWKEKAYRDDFKERPAEVVAES